MMVQRDQQVQPDLREPQGRQVQQEPQVLRVRQGLQVPPDRPVQSDHKAHFLPKGREALIWVRWS